MFLFVINAGEFGQIILHDIMRIIMNRLQSFLFYYLPPLLWAGVIFYFSSLSDLKSALPGFFDLILRKIAHMTEFGILAVLCLRMFLLKKGKPLDLRKNLGPEKVYLKEAFITAFILSLLYSFTDEFHQSFVFGRTGALGDVLIDAMGIIIGIYLFMRWKLRVQN